MHKYVLGVDGGSSKTHCALFDFDGNMIDFMQIGSTNHETLIGSYAEFNEKMGGMIREIIGRNHVGIDAIHLSVLGLSGVDTKSQHSYICKEIKKIGLQDFLVCNDSFLGIKAGSKKGFGIGVINGSGCTVCGVNKSGRTFLIGGQGEFTGEPGGGGFLGYYAIRSVYNALFREGKKTLMKDILFEKFQIKSNFEFIDVIRENIDDHKIKVGELAKVVFEAANNSDELALKVLQYMGNEIGISINGVIRELGFYKNEELDVILAGSINVKGENITYLETLKKKVIGEHNDMNINFSILKQPPVAGAIVWALEQVNGGQTFYDKIMSQFNGM